MSPRKPNFLAEFLTDHDKYDICEPVVGELNEFATSRATYFYGNGELIISPANDCHEQETYHVDRYGSNLVLVGPE